MDLFEFLKGFSSKDKSVMKRYHVRPDKIDLIFKLRCVESISKVFERGVRKLQVNLSNGKKAYVDDYIVKLPNGEWDVIRDQL